MDIGEKVLERLATSDKCTIVVQKQPDGKMRVTSGSWEARRCFTRHRKRRKRGLFVRPIIVTKDQLDQLEERGYLNPGDRGNRVDECEAIANFLTDSLAKSS